MPVVGHEHEAQAGEEEARQAVMEALFADPHALARGVDPDSAAGDRTLLGMAWRLHLCISAPLIGTDKPLL